MLTHWAVFDDSLRLMRLDDSIERAFVQACENEPQIARLGALTRGGGKWMHPLLAEAREKWGNPDEHPLIDRRLAWVVGGISHQACDTVAKALLSKHAGSEWNLTHEVLQRNPEVKGRENEVDVDRVQECSAYYDAYVFRKVYLDGKESPFTQKFLTADWGPGADALEEYMGTVFQRSLLSAHTLRPPAASEGHAAFIAWQDEVFKFMQPRYLFPKWWIQAYNNPDPAKMADYAVETEFYLDSDPIIGVARRIHRGEAVSAKEIQAASADDVNQSTYGQALELSLRYLRNATAYWHRKADTLVAPNAYKPKWAVAQPAAE
jgi:hypothetical protein